MDRDGYNYFIDLRGDSLDDDTRRSMTALAIATASLILFGGLVCTVLILIGLGVL